MRSKKLLKKMNQMKRRRATQSKKRTTRVTVDFPIHQHRKLKAVAALEGVSIQDYIRSRVLLEIKDEVILDNELNPIVKRIIEENRDALKRLADK